MRALGADAVILSPIVTRSTDCANPGALDFSNLDQRYGTLEDFNGLLNKAKKLGGFVNPKFFMLFMTQFVIEKIIALSTLIMFCGYKSMKTIVIILWHVH